MKKYLPIILLLVGVVVLIGSFLFVKNQKKVTPEEDGEETALVEVPADERPVLSLRPTSDGHFLNLKIEKLLAGAETMDYELLYQTSNDITQGVPGTVTLTDENVYEAELLLGTESSGKFRYDDGVETGSFTVRFRNSDGKLMAKFVSEFHLISGSTELTSIDGNFVYKPAKKASGYFVVMNTVGFPDDAKSDFTGEPYGVFYSEDGSISGEVDMKTTGVYYWKDGKWVKLENKNSPNTGFFMGAS